MVVGGSQLVALRLAEGLGEAVILDAPVRRIEQSASGVRLESDGVTVEARRAIVSIPPALAGRIDYAPSLPGSRDQLTQRLPQGSVIKAQAIYDEPFWGAEGLSGAAAHTALPVSLPSTTPRPMACRGSCSGSSKDETPVGSGRPKPRKGDT